MYSFKSFNCAGHHYQEAQDSSTFGVTAKGVELDFAKTQDWKDNTVVKSLTGGVGMLLKNTKWKLLKAKHSSLTKIHCVLFTQTQHKLTHSIMLATGSRPIEIPGFKFGGRVLDSTGGLNLKEVPKNSLLSVAVSSVLN